MWSVVVCGDLWWSVVVCGGLWYLDSPILTTASIKSNILFKNRKRKVYFATFTKIQFKPVHEISNNVVCARLACTYEKSDQSLC